jgi:hypothetical protein
MLIQSSLTGRVPYAPLLDLHTNVPSASPTLVKKLQSDRLGEGQECGQRDRDAGKYDVLLFPFFLFYGI